MLKRLFIRNIALIEEMEVLWQKGFNVITGETGAGKSITVEALLLILGERATSDLIREGQMTGKVEGTFELKSSKEIDALLLSQGIDQEEGQIVIRREISSDGKSRAFINHSQVTLSLLKTLGEYLIDLHGQHEHQSLLKPSSQRDFLDILGDHMPVRESIEGIYRSLQEMISKKQILEASLSDKERQLDYLRFQEKEMAQLNLEEGEENRLEGEDNMLSHSEKIRGLLGHIDEIVNQSEPSLSELLSKLFVDLHELVQIDGSILKDVEAAEEIRYCLEDIQNILRNKFHSLDADPERLRWIEERLLEIKRLKKKFGDDLSGVLSDVRKKILDLEKGEEGIQEIEIEIQKLQNQYDKAASNLSKLRKEQGQKLSKNVVQELKELGMKGCDFKVEINEGPMGPHGRDEVVFHIATNAGQSLKPLQDVVSGGELSRIMLAIKTLLSKKSFVPILIFDEIDVNLGGETAHKVAVKLKQLSRGHQIIVITHLAQIAAYADHHFFVEKVHSGKNVHTQLSYLESRDRPREVARMLGGSKATEAALSHAKELLDVGQK